MNQKSAAAFALALLVSACSSGLLRDEGGDPELTEIAGSGLSKAAGGTNGDYDYCTGATPCTAGEGDCDSDSECAPGLVCGTDNGLRFGFPDGHDVCWPATCTDGIQDGDETGVDSGGSCGTPPTCNATNGASDACSSACKCDAGWGDCDSDAQCKSGLVCGTDNGPRFGMPEGYDACVAVHCTNGTTDADETGVDCGGSCGTCPPACNATNGTPNTCSGACKCDAGWGDCDGDFQCKAGLACGTDNGARFGMADEYDVCWPVHCQNGVTDADETGVDVGGSCGTPAACLANGTANTCTSSCKCAVGWGDCDLDSQCQAGLVCGNNNGLRFNLPDDFDVCWPPTCTNGIQDGDETGVDAGGSCGTPPECNATNGGVSTCTNACPCAAGWGDCDFDSQCAAGLVCGTDNGPQFGMPAGYDVCWGATCTNAVQDGNETGVDCGGSCAPCPYEATIGGAVYGLSGNDLVLSSPGLSDLTLPAGAMVFTFAEKLQQGSSYAVTVSTQPSGLTCTVQNGAGTVGTTDVTNIEVYCTANWSAVAAGYRHTLAVKTDGSLWAWGDNTYGQLGTGASGGTQTLPVQIASEGFIAVAAGNRHSLALGTDGTLWSWGDNYYGQLGTGTAHNYPYPVGTGYESITASANHSLGVKSGGSLWAWGANSAGQLGNGSTSAEASPTQVQVGSGFASVSTGTFHSIGVGLDGTLLTWGADAFGQLGNGAAGAVLVPTPIASGFASAAAGGTHNVAVTSDGRLFTWGNNSAGQLGIGTAGSTRASPVQVGTGFVSAAAGTDHSMALAGDELWGWGANGSGQLGIGTIANRTTPGPLMAAVAVADGATHTAVVKTDGTLWTWGDNAYGQLGIGPTPPVSLAPVQVVTP